MTTSTDRSHGPDLGDFKDVEVIDVLVKPGDAIDARNAARSRSRPRRRRWTCRRPRPASYVERQVKTRCAVSKGDVIGRRSAARARQRRRSDRQLATVRADKPRQAEDALRARRADCGARARRPREGRASIAGAARRTHADIGDSTKSASTCW